MFVLKTKCLIAKKYSFEKMFNCGNLRKKNSQSYVYK